MILVESLFVQAGDFRLDDVSFEVPTGGYGVLMGKTGCGKTTILETIAGLKPLKNGRIMLGNVDVTRLKPAERNVGLVPQDGALFTTMSVRDHLAFALAVRRASAKVIQRRVDELVDLLEIKSLLDRGTAGLSGGERQRVGLGRALSFKPATLLLDEPLGALDDGTHSQITELLKRVQQETGVTTLHITHDHEEAAALADVLLELVDGQVTPRIISAKM